MFKEKLEKSLSKEWNVDVKLEVPPNNEMGDFAFPCFQFSKLLKKSPVQIAKDFINSVPKINFVDRIEANGPYVNIFIKKEALAEEVISTILSEKEKYGNEKSAGTIVIDMSSPNIAKPFHFGTLRSTLQGNALNLLFEKLGYKTVKVNHLGDWGTQFGAVLAAFEKWGSQKDLKQDPIHYLVGLYKKWHEFEERDMHAHEKAKEWFKKLEDNDQTALNLWKQFRDLSIEEFKKTYRALNIEFDEYQGEAFYNDKIESTIKACKDAGITVVDQGALVVKLDKEEVPCMLKKTDGTSTYASRDLSAILYRIKTYNPKKILYLTGAEQKLHFQQVFEVAKKLGVKTELIHVDFGMYLSPSGGKMSTRHGKTVEMSDVMNEIEELALKTINKKNPELKDKQKTAHTVAVCAMIFQDLSSDRIKDIVFDEKRMLEFEGDTGPYVQYTNARANSILEKSKAKPKLIADLLTNDKELNLIKMLANFPDKITHAAKDCKPHVITQYLLETSRAFNEFYHACPVIQDSKQLEESRLALVKAAITVLEEGMKLLGVVPLKEM